MAELESLQWPVVERDFGVGKVQIVGAPDLAARLADALGFAPPTAANRISQDARMGCAWVAPHEWLLVGDADAVGSATDRIDAAFRDDALALVLNVSQGSTAWRLSGAQAIDRLAAYCPIDLHPDAFPTGSATRTRFGDIGVFLTRIHDCPSFWLVADQSYADYVTHLLDHGVA
jgi:heterotetrameric sarcosine oxidase gamma subunit